jgi:hypothetical protein
MGGFNPAWFIQVALGALLMWLDKWTQDGQHAKARHWILLSLSILFLVIGVVGVSIDAKEKWWPYDPFKHSRDIYRSRLGNLLDQSPIKSISGNYQAAYEHARLLWIADLRIIYMIPTGVGAQKWLQADQPYQSQCGSEWTDKQFLAEQFKTIIGAHTFYHPSEELPECGKRTPPNGNG